MVLSLGCSLLLAAALTTPVPAADQAEVLHSSETPTTLRFFFRPDPAMMGGQMREFAIVKLYVDDLYVGDSIETYGYTPTLRFEKGTKKIRAEKPGYKPFERTMTFLGNGSTQILVIDFEKIKE